MKENNNNNGFMTKSKYVLVSTIDEVETMQLYMAGLIRFYESKEIAAYKKPPIMNEIQKVSRWLRGISINEAKRVA